MMAGWLLKVDGRMVVVEDVAEEAGWLLLEEPVMV